MTENREFWHDYLTEEEKHPEIMKILVHKGGLLTGIISLFLLAVLYLNHAVYFLSPDKKVNSDILVVEGWLEDENLIQAAREFCSGNYQVLITTGIKRSDGFVLGLSGLLQFRNMNVSFPKDSIYSIKLNLHGTEVDNINACFIFVFNDSVIYTGYAKKRPVDISFSFKSSDRLNYISVGFINDAVKRKSDRNLIVRSVEINNTLFEANDSNVFYRIEKSGEIVEKQLDLTKAHEAARFIKKQKDCEKQVIALGSDHIVKGSKTYTSAVEVKKWLDLQEKYKNSSITIFTTDIHARRTLISYRKCLKNREIGIISATIPIAKDVKWWNNAPLFKHILRESSGAAWAFLFL